MTRRTRANSSASRRPSADAELRTPSTCIIYPDAAGSHRTSSYPGASMSITPDSLPQLRFEILEAAAHRIGRATQVVGGLPSCDAEVSTEKAAKLIRACSLSLSGAALRAGVHVVANAMPFRWGRPATIFQSRLFVSYARQMPGQWEIARDYSGRQY